MSVLSPTARPAPRRPGPTAPAEVAPAPAAPPASLSTGGQFDPGLTDRVDLSELPAPPASLPAPDPSA